MTHKICLSAAALLALLLALPAPALAYDGATPDQPNRLSAGLSHTAYVDEHGTLWTWGSNQEGQLGAETQETGVDREGNQVAVSGTSLAVLEDVRSVAAGGDFTVALKTDGTLWAWGGNDYGQLGNGTVVSAAQPVQVLDQVTAVSAGDYHAAAISTDGTLYTWGSNLDGQLGTGGLGDTTDEETGAMLQLTPTAVSLPAAVSNVTVGAGHTAAILSDGTLWTWGRNDAMQLGLTEAGAQVWEPGQVVELLPVQAVSAGTDQTVCLLTDGEVQAWGSPAMGQLGSGTPQEKAAEPDVQTADAGAVRVDIPSQKGMDRVPLVLLAASGIVLVVVGVVTRRH